VERFQPRTQSDLHRKLTRRRAAKSGPAPSHFFGDGHSGTARDVHQNQSVDIDSVAGKNGGSTILGQAREVESN
jgi:hypothetical protein